ncbi:MAG TPA: hypothetical protein VIE64_03885 [Solirubrobacterales bacterium]|jgi:hypothetical protein
MAAALAILVVSVAGCGGGTKTVTATAEKQPSTEESSGSSQSEGAVSLGGSETEEAGYPSVEQVGQAIVADIERRYDLSFESGSCENFAPEAGGAPVYICEIKIGGEWHGNIQATIHPDGSFEWEDLSGSREEFEGDELTVSE